MSSGSISFSFLGFLITQPKIGILYFLIYSFLKSTAFWLKKYFSGSANIASSAKWILLAVINLNKDGLVNVIDFCLKKKNTKNFLLLLYLYVN